MKTIQVYFTYNTAGGIFSKAIMWYESSNYSHCAMEFQLVKLNTSVIYHSSLSSGVNFYAKSRFDSKNTIVKTYTLQVSDELYTCVMKGLINNCGIEYALLQNVGIVIVDLARRLFKHKMRNPFKRGQNCSELLFREVLVKVQPELADKYDPDTITPKQVDEILQAYQGMSK